MKREHGPAKPRASERFTESFHRALANCDIVFPKSRLALITGRAREEHQLVVNKRADQDDQHEGAKK